MPLLQKVPYDVVRDFSPVSQITREAFSGRTARAGVESALLAQHGFHGSREILTTENGFFHAFTGNREIGNETAVDLGKKSLVAQR